MKIKEIREWINTGIAFLGLIVLIVATIFGVTELQSINVNLNELNSKKIITSEIELINEKYNSSGRIFSNGSGICINNC